MNIHFSGLKRPPRPSPDSSDKWMDHQKLVANSESNWLNIRNSPTLKVGENTWLIHEATEITKQIRSLLESFGHPEIQLHGTTEALIKCSPMSIERLKSSNISREHLHSRHLINIHDRTTWRRLQVFERINSDESPLSATDAEHDPPEQKYHRGFRCTDHNQLHRDQRRVRTDCSRVVYQSIWIMTTPSVSFVVV